jgi:hypothetical protein
MSLDREKRQEGIRKVKAYTKYSGMAYQIFGLLAVTIWLGLKADAYFGNESKLITAGASLVVLIAYLYKLSTTVLKK